MAKEAPQIFWPEREAIAEGQDSKRERKIWGKADTGQNQFFSHDVYKKDPEKVL